MSDVESVPVAARAAAILLWLVAAGWALPALWLMWWVAVRGRLPVLPYIGEPNGGPFYTAVPHDAFIILLGLSLVLGIVQVVAGVLLWDGQRSGALLQFAILPIEAAFWYGFELPIPPIFAAIRVVLVLIALPRGVERDHRRRYRRCRAVRSGSSIWTLCAAARPTNDARR